jgi:uncharacterized protein YndB with AHSA1/START domain
MSTGVSSQETDVVGKTDGPPVVELSRTVAAPLTHVWEVLVSPAGSGAFLGSGAVLGGKGEPYHCEDGTGGVVRSYHPLEQLRVSWHEHPDAPASVIELDLRPEGDATVLDLTQSHLPEGADVPALASRWSAGLDALAARVEA